jgi:hypothetical protein
MHHPLWTHCDAIVDENPPTFISHYVGKGNYPPKWANIASKYGM